MQVSRKVGVINYVCNFHLFLSEFDFAFVHVLNYFLPYFMIRKMHVSY